MNLKSKSYLLETPVTQTDFRADFPILNQEMNGYPIVYLDNAATTQKPGVVIKRILNYYENENSNVHRGIHSLSARATETYENARETIKTFINAEDAREIIFVRGTTEAINLVAWSFAREQVGKGDEIVVSMMEHHSNIVPWQLLCQYKGAKLRVIPIHGDGELDRNAYVDMLNNRTRLVSITHASNVLGTLNPLAEIIGEAHARGIPVLVDGAQSVPHVPIDVQDLDCDFFAFSGHKMYGPMGIGVLYGKMELLEQMSPYQAGGDMIRSVTFNKTTYNSLPYKFEAGTPNVAGAVGLASAVDYLREIGIDNINQHETRLLQYAKTMLNNVEGLHVLGNPINKTSVVSFIMDNVHPHDIGTMLDQKGIAIRAGHHCAQPLMDFFSVPATARVSFALYNRVEEIDLLIQTLQDTMEMFAQ